MTLLPTLVAIASAFVLSACAPLPVIAAAHAKRGEALTQSSASLVASAAAWPAAQWWKRYGDAQLDTLMDEALDAAPDVDTALARLERAGGLAQQQGAALRPKADATASAEETKQSYNNLMPKSQLPLGWHPYGRAALEFSWELDFWGRNRAAFAAATSELEAAQADLAQARVALTTALASAYIHLDELYADRDTAESALQVREQSRALTLERRSNGLETDGTVHQMDARRAQSRGDLLAIDESIELQRNAIAALLGAGPDRGRAIVRPLLRLQAGQGLPAAVPANLLGRRPDLIASRLRVEATAKRIAVARAGFYPNVNLSAVLGLQSLGLGMLTHSGSDMGSVGPAISLPLFDQGLLRGQYAAAGASYDEAVAAYNANLVQALHEVADAAASERALRDELAQAEAAVTASGAAYRVAQDRYRGGLANYLEVLVSEDTLLTSQRELTRLQARSLALDVSLTRALGGGFETAAPELDPPTRG